jgi:hypothetical protein
VLRQDADANVPGQSGISQGEAVCGLSSGAEKPSDTRRRDHAPTVRRSLGLHPEYITGLPCIHCASRWLPVLCGRGRRDFALDLFGRSLESFFENRAEPYFRLFSNMKYSYGLF